MNMLGGERLEDDFSILCATFTMSPLIFPSAAVGGGFLNTIPSTWPTTIWRPYRESLAVPWGDLLPLAIEVARHETVDGLLHVGDISWTRPFRSASPECGRSGKHASLCSRLVLGCLAEVLIFRFG